MLVNVMRGEEVTYLTFHIIDEARPVLREILHSNSRSNYLLEFSQGTRCRPEVLELEDTLQNRRKVGDCYVLPQTLMRADCVRHVLMQRAI